MVSKRVHAISKTCVFYHFSFLFVYILQVRVGSYLKSVLKLALKRSHLTFRQIISISFIYNFLNNIDSKRKSIRFHFPFFQVSYYEILRVTLHRDYVILVFLQPLPLFLKFTIRVHNIFTVASNNILDSKEKSLVFRGKRLVRYLPMIQDVRIQQQERIYDNDVVRFASSYIFVSLRPPLPPSSAYVTRLVELTETPELNSMYNGATVNFTTATRHKLE